MISVLGQRFDIGIRSAIGFSPWNSVLIYVLEECFDNSIWRVFDIYIRIIFISVLG